MKVSILADFFMDVKNWIYEWDSITFGIVLGIVVLLMALSAISFIKAIIPGEGKKPKFKIVQLLFLALLVAALVIILNIKA